MKAIAHDRYGSPEVLELREFDKPAPTGNEVLVRVHAVSVNARDWHQMRGDPYLARLTFGVRQPKVKILGTDFAGRVEAVGPAVRRLRPGDEVFGEADRAFAEYVSASEDVVDTKPADLTFEQAAAIPLAGNTAVIGLRDVAQVRPGQRVLINGASGGVGTFAVQIAKSYGAEVTCVCSARNADLVASLGADHLIDYAKEDFTRTGQRYDVVFDLVANRSLADLRRALTPTGALLLSGGGVSEGGSPVGPMGIYFKAQALKPFVRQRLLQVGAKPSVEILAALRELVESGKVAPAIDRTYGSLSEVPEAIRYMEVEHTRAKVVVTV